MTAPPGSPLGLLLPEAALAAGLVAILASDMVPALASRRIAAWLGIAACGSGLALATASGSGAVASMLAVDATARLARLLILPVAAIVLLAGAGERRGRNDNGAWSAAVVALALGACLAALACNFVSLWLGLELIALASYTLVTFGGGDRRSGEAGMKFVLFGGAASAAMLYGISHVYGATGHLDFAGIGAGFAATGALALLPALLLAAAGLAYKLTLVPLHFYAPDVYQGSPALGLAAVSTLPKIAATAALWRGLQLAVPATVVAPGVVAAGLAVVAAASMLFASFTALVQRDGKRIVAFSGIGHGGAVALAVACQPGSDAAGAAGFYLLTYVGANVGALVCLSVLERRAASCDLRVLAGSGRQEPWVASLLCVFLLSLAGMPPLAGFLGKWGVLQLAFARGTAVGGPAALVVAALAFLLATAVSAWSYLLIVRAVVFAPADGGAVAPPPVGRLPAATIVALVVCFAAVLGLGLWLDGLVLLRGAA